MTTSPRLDEQWHGAKQRATLAHEAHDALGMLEAETEAEYISAASDLIGMLDRLARECQGVSARLEMETAPHPAEGWAPNPLGIVQGAGLDIDRTCGRLATLRETIRGIASARKAAER